MIEIYELAKSEYGARLVNTFYPTNDPQTIDFRESHKKPRRDLGVWGLAPSFFDSETGSAAIRKEITETGGLA